ncbi:MAG: hypothetical protein R3B93_08115 [Bacteroidia bacterium]
MKTKAKNRITDNAILLLITAVSKDVKRIVSAHQLSPHYPVDGQPKLKYYLESGEWKQKGNFATYQTPRALVLPKIIRGFILVRFIQSGMGRCRIDLPYFYDVRMMKLPRVSIKARLGNEPGF